MTGDEPLAALRTRLSGVKQALLDWRIRERLRTPAASHEVVLCRDAMGPAPLSLTQERFWAGRRREALSVASTIPMVFRIAGPLDLGCLRRALQQVVDRHEVLRTSFREDAAGPVQVIWPGLRLQLPLIDLGRIGLAGAHAEACRQSVADGLRSFDYQCAPPFRMSLFRCAPDEHRLLFTIHHVAFDGWSEAVLFGEMVALYDAFRQGLPSPLAPLAAQYRDYARWQRRTCTGQVQSEQERFWRDQLQGAAPLDLRNGRRRPARPSFAAAVEGIKVPVDLEQRLDAFAVANGATLFMTLLAGFNLLLHHETGREDIVISCFFANRKRVEIESLIGNFLAVLPLRTRLTGADSFREVLRRVRGTTLAAAEHPDFLPEAAPADGAAGQPGEQPPNSSIMFQLLKLPLARQPMADLEVSRILVDTGKIRVDLSLFLIQSDGLFGRFRYNRDVLDAQRVAHLRQRFLELLAAAVAQPDQPLSQLLAGAAAAGGHPASR